MTTILVKPNTEMPVQIAMVIREMAILRVLKFLKIFLLINTGSKRATVEKIKEIAVPSNATNKMTLYKIFSHGNANLVVTKYTGNVWPRTSGEKPNNMIQIIAKNAPFKRVPISIKRLQS